MKTHYEQLGVAEDATDDEIKRAYRAKAKVTHPDAGGNQSEFEPIVQAYEVLSNPERRLLYDATGTDKRLPIDIAVQEILLENFSAALNANQDMEIVAAVRRQIDTKTKAIPEERRELEARKKKWLAKRDRIKSSGPVNVVHLIIDSEVKGIDGQLTHLTYQEEIGTACLVALDEYSEEWEEPVPLSQMPSVFMEILGAPPRRRPW